MMPEQTRASGDFTFNGLPASYVLCDAPWDCQVTGRIQLGSRPVNMICVFRASRGSSAWQIAAPDEWPDLVFADTGDSVWAEHPRPSVAAVKNGRRDLLVRWREVADSQHVLTAMCLRQINALQRADADAIAVLKSYGKAHRRRTKLLNKLSVSPTLAADYHRAANNLTVPSADFIAKLRQLSQS